ncbi:MAG: ThiF family adenylyltransferase [Solirubrobacteraceae bacterium]
MRPDDPLSRTTRLINQEFFNASANEDAIAAGLAATTIRLIADDANMSSRSGQAALVTSWQLIARTGIKIDLLAPEADLLLDVPPLRRPTLKAALLDLGRDLIAGLDTAPQPEHADATFCFGDSTCDEQEPTWIAATELGCLLTHEKAHTTRLECDFPIGALAASAATAAIALDAALPNIEHATNLQRSTRARPNPGPPVHIDLRRLFPELDTRALHVGDIDMVSAGAVNNAFLATLLWVPHASNNLRTLDDDTVGLDNLNRCLQFRASDAKQRRPKVQALAQASTADLRITGIPQRYGPESSVQILPFAERVVVGVDDIEARWRVQEAQPAYLYIGATNNKEALVTTHHPGEPCAACAHPDPLELADGDFVPTISFISFWAGLLQVCALLAEQAGPRSAKRITVYPYGLGQGNWGEAKGLSPRARCPISCSASAAAS